jgi:chorismate dehydratase
LRGISGIWAEKKAMRLRISLVSYLNAAPLGWSFLHGPARDRFQITLDSPANCADQLASGAVDIGLIPVIEYQRIAGLRVIPEIAIAASREVRSVLLVRRRGNTAMRSIALDTSSRTSAALLKLLIQTRLGLNPEFIPHEPEIDVMLRRCDAALIIGDAALRCSPEEFDITDLAAEWQDWQSHPFVFAFWACRGDIPLPEDLVKTFVKAKNWGLDRIPEIALHYSRKLDLPVDFLEGYLRHNLDHSLGERHKLGLERFYQLSHDAGLTATNRHVDFIAPE